MTFEELVKIEPALGELLTEAKRVKGKPGFCANRVWYPDFKPRLLRLVGFDARNAALRSHLAYDLAYSTIYKALPDCRHEGGI